VNRLFQEARDTDVGDQLGRGLLHIAKVERLAETARIMDRVKLLPLAVLDAGEEVTSKAAQFKAGHGLPCADCFAAATTTKNEVLVSSP
jgi:predicted nucleic acid-binding protein